MWTHDDRQRQTDKQTRTKRFGEAKVASILGAQVFFAMIFYSKKVPYRKRHREITTFFGISAPLISLFAHN